MNTLSISGNIRSSKQELVAKHSPRMTGKVRAMYKNRVVEWSPYATEKEVICLVCCLGDVCKLSRSPI